MTTNPLLDLLKDTVAASGLPLTTDLLKQFVSAQMNVADNFQLFDASGVVVNSNKTILYSGNFIDPETGDKIWTGVIAEDMAARGSESVRVIQNTRMGRFLDALWRSGRWGSRHSLTIST